MGLKLSKEEIADVVAGKEMAIEKVLIKMKDKIDNYGEESRVRETGLRQSNEFSSKQPQSTSPRKSWK